MMEDLQTLKRTLDAVYVHGERNVYYMLGAMQLVDKLIADAEKEADTDG